MGAIATLSEGFRQMKRCINIISVIFLINIIWNVFIMPFAEQSISTTQTQGQWNPQLFALSIVFVLISIFLQGGVLGVARELVTTSEAIKINTFFRYCSKFYLRLIGLALIALLFFFIFMLPIGMLVSLFLYIQNPLAKVLFGGGALILIIAGCICFLPFIIFPYALVGSDIGLFQAIKEGIGFTKNNFIKFIVMLILLFLMALGIILLITLVITPISLFIKGLAFKMVGGFVVSGINAFLSLFISFVLMYFYLNIEQSRSGEVKPAEAT